MAKYADTSSYTDEEILLWEKIAEHSGETVLTSSSLPFTYNVRGNELFVSRRDKSLTRSTVNRSYRTAMEIIARDGEVKGPKMLGTFGASYIYAIFKKIGVI